MLAPKAGHNSSRRKNFINLDHQTDLAAYVCVVVCLQIFFAEFINLGTLPVDNPPHLNIRPTPRDASIYTVYR